MIHFGHPTGNPNSHYAALAHWKTGKLEAFCVPWFPKKWDLGLLGLVPGLPREVEILQRRRFEPLANAPKVQGRGCNYEIKQHGRCLYDSKLAELLGLNHF